MAIQAPLRTHRMTEERMAQEKDSKWGPFENGVTITISGGFRSVPGGDVTSLIEWIDKSEHPGHYTWDITNIDNDSETYQFTFSDPDVAFEFKMRFA